VPSGTNGTIEFRLYGPFNSPSDITASSCTPAKLVSGAGSTKTVTNFNPASPNYTSNSYTTNTAGYYNWTAQFTSTTAGVNSTGEVGCGDTTEQSQVNKKQPAISTSATTPVTLGASIKDTATLSNATSDATGSITFKLYDSLADCNADTDVKFTSTNSNVNGNGPYDSQSYTPTAAGTYYWLASYGGDGNNNAVSGACSDANEQSVVGPRNPSLSTNATQSVTIGSPISDTATLSGATSNATGGITFKLYGPFDPSTPASGDTCDASTLKTTLGPVAIGSPNGSGNYVVPSGNYTPTAVGRYQWVASYASGDTNNSDVASACRDANEASVVGKAPSKVNTEQSFYPNDKATLSADAGGTPTGSVDFSLFDNDSCSGAPLLSATNRPLTGGVASTNNTTVAVSTSDTYYWKVVYGGDGSHNGVTSCTENTDMTINNGGTVTGN
jgi:hypothetical protein